jgi:hypothetical protein
MGRNFRVVPDYLVTANTDKSHGRHVESLTGPAKTNRRHIGLEDLPGVFDEPASFQSNKRKRQCPGPSAPHLHHKTTKEINHETHPIT